MVDEIYVAQELERILPHDPICVTSFPPHRQDERCDCGADKRREDVLELFRRLDLDERKGTCPNSWKVLMERAERRPKSQRKEG